MVRFCVWKKAQVVAVLLGSSLLLMLFTALTALLLLPEDAFRQAAAAAFADSELTYAVTAEVPPEDKTLRVEVLRATPPPIETKRVLIYHTHTWEAFRQVEGNLYQETEKWRSKDDTVNMVAVGKALSANLEALGCTVVQDTTVFEPPDLSTAYQRSLSMLKARQAAGEHYDLYIDLHRDAVSAASTLKRTVQIGGEEVARFMVLVGKGQAYEEKPDWEANYALAEKITQSMNRQVEGICRNVKIKTGRFNQHIAPHCVLIECGVNDNTLEQVLRGIPYLAQAIMEALME